LTRAPRLVVLGATGFIGSHLVAYGQADGADITPITMARVQESPGGTGPSRAATARPGATGDTATRDAATRWRRDNQAAFDDLCCSLATFDVVINAAGDPRAGATATGNLFAANAVLPAVVAQATHAAGVRRLVHVSTAAVQGRLDPLDETAMHLPLSPYAASKAGGERVLLDADPAQGQICAELVVYRPTSVQAVRHQATRAFASVMSRMPFVPVEGSGERPVPVAQLDNVAAGILFAATMARPAPIVLQPHENMTVRRLVELFGARRIVAVPPRAANVALDQVGLLTRRSAYLTSRLRWFELLLRGQTTEAKVLPTEGFCVPVGAEGWVALAEAERVDLRDRRSTRRRS
jgi:nucleoside-diphosphate-sugar epimerase